MCQTSLFRVTSVSRRFSTISMLKSSVKPEWFYATDVPRTQPFDPEYTPAASPKKFKQFSLYDSQKLEEAYQQRIKEPKNEIASVPVNEDALFQVNLDRMVLSPAYWEGPTYEVRRGLWFDSYNRPLHSEITNELEEFCSTINFEEQQKANFNSQDVFAFDKKYKEGKLAIFLNKETAFLLPDLEGGQFQLKYLRSSLAQSLPINAIKVNRGYKKPTSSTALVDAKSSIANGLIEQTKKLGRLSDLINWELSGILNTKADEKDNKEKEKQYGDILEREIETDYDNNKSVHSNTNRKIYDLVLCVHGIGQTLGKKYEYVNFAHTINLLRTNMKKLYGISSELQNLNKQRNNSDWETNCGVQVLPISWRQSIGFETDILELNKENPQLPTLSNITLQGVLPLRQLLGDVALDILLYGEPYYREKILQEVSKSLNKVYHLFQEKHGNFQGRAHLIGHSLGSLILYDILCDQVKYKLDFDVGNYFSIGSPVGVFKLIQRTKIGDSKLPSSRQDDISTSSPRCQNMYNVFHECDPIAYRLEPLVDTRMAQYQQEYLAHFHDDGITSKVLEIGGSFLKELPGIDKTPNKKRLQNAPKKVELDQAIANKLKRLNDTGRLDYSLSPNLLDVDMISAIKSHISYFEDLDIAGFVLQETIRPRHMAGSVYVKTLAAKGGTANKIDEKE